VEEDFQRKVMELLSSNQSIPEQELERK